MGETIGWKEKIEEFDKDLMIRMKEIRHYEVNSGDMDLVLKSRVSRLLGFPSRVSAPWWRSAAHEWRFRNRDRDNEVSRRRGRADRSRRKVSIAKCKAAWYVENRSAVICRVMANDKLHRVKRNAYRQAWKKQKRLKLHRCLLEVLLCLMIAGLPGRQGRSA